MIRIRAVAALLILVVLTSFKPDNLPKEFSDLIVRAGMTFDPPADFAETKLIPNRQMNYEYAIIHKGRKFEVRYAIRPLDNMLRAFTGQEKNKQPGDVNINPNNFYRASFQAIVLNISGGKMSRINEFPKPAVKAEFNADWGATTIIEAGKELARNTNTAW